MCISITHCGASTHPLGPAPACLHQVLEVSVVDMLGAEARDVLDDPRPRGQRYRLDSFDFKGAGEGGLLIKKVGNSSSDKTVKVPVVRQRVTTGGGALVLLVLLVRAMMLGGGDGAMRWQVGDSAAGQPGTCTCVMLLQPQRCRSAAAACSMALARMACSSALMPWAAAGWHACTVLL